MVVERADRRASARDIMIGTTPYVIVMILLVALLFVVPDLALWLPRRMMARCG